MPQNMAKIKVTAMVEVKTYIFVEKEIEITEDPETKVLEQAVNEIENETKYDDFDYEITSIKTESIKGE